MLMIDKNKMRKELVHTQALSLNMNKIKKKRLE